MVGRRSTQTGGGSANFAALATPSPDTSHVDTTIVVVPRESFDLLPATVRRLRRTTRHPHRLLVLEGGAPEAIRNELRAEIADDPDIDVRYSDRWLLPHEAVNQAATLVDTEFVCFVDNDVEVDEGWLDALVTCAREEGAACVHPLYLETALDDPDASIHVSEGTLEWKRVGDQFELSVRMTNVQKPVADYRERNPKPSQFFEWHAVLFRRDALASLVPLPDMTVFLHIDCSLRLIRAGERIVYEPRSVVAYDAKRPFGLQGEARAYLDFRWDLRRAERSIESFARRWHLTPSSVESKRRWVRLRVQQHEGAAKAEVVAPRPTRSV